MLDLAPYNKDSRCPKCDCAGISTDYVPDAWPTDEIDLKYSCYLLSDKTLPERRYFQQPPEIPEHMLRQCFNCKHRWKEQPLDKGNIND